MLLDSTELHKTGSNVLIAIQDFPGHSNSSAPYYECDSKLRFAGSGSPLVRAFARHVLRRSATNLALVHCIYNVSYAPSSLGASSYDGSLLSGDEQQRLYGHSLHLTTGLCPSQCFNNVQ
jgi:hypothetical protein